MRERLMDILVGERGILVGGGWISNSSVLLFSCVTRFHEQAGLACSPEHIGSCVCLCLELHGGHPREELLLASYFPVPALFPPSFLAVVVSIPLSVTHPALCARCGRPL